METMTHAAQRRTAGSRDNTAYTRTSSDGAVAAVALENLAGGERRTGLDKVEHAND
jgi:hypothetical protein